MRSVRPPPSQEEFDRISIPPYSDVAKLSLGGSWLRLARKIHGHSFFASAGSRLTPRSLTFPCVYLALDQETCVAEVWGDRFYDHRAQGRPVFPMRQPEAEEWEFFESSSLPVMNLCDLTSSDVKLATGLDSTTLYHTDFDATQQWADLIANHPAKFDGIHYRSRHTDLDCIVVWKRPNSDDPRITFSQVGPFFNSAASFSVAKKIGITLSFTPTSPVS